MRWPFRFYLNLYIYRVCDYDRNFQFIYLSINVLSFFFLPNSMFTDVSCAMCRYILLIPILVKAACLLVYAPSHREGYDAVNSRAAEIRNMKFSERSRGGWLWWGHATCQWPVTRREEARWRDQELSAACVLTPELSPLSLSRDDTSRESG